jgi:hypothetical protein
LRPLSGEAPYAGVVSLDIARIAPGLRIGLTSTVTGPRTFYSPASLKQISGAAELGSYVEWRDEGAALRLQFDNLLDSQMRSTESLFERDRSAGLVIQTSHQALGGAALSLTLKKAI